MPAVIREFSDNDRVALQRALNLACQALSIVDQVAPSTTAGVRGQHFVDEINDLVAAAA